VDCGLCNYPLVCKVSQFALFTGARESFVLQHSQLGTGRVRAGTVFATTVFILPLLESVSALQVTPVPEESVTVDQYLQAECERHEKHVAVGPIS